MQPTTIYSRHEVQHLKRERQARKESSEAEQDDSEEESGREVYDLKEKEKFLGYKVEPFSMQHSLEDRPVDSEGNYLHPT